MYHTKRTPGGRLPAIFLSLALCLSLAAVAPVTARAADNVPYYDPITDTVLYADSVTPLTGNETTLTDGCYLTSGTITDNSRITVNGDVSIILEDGCVFNVPYGIEVTPGNSLTIYAQSTDAETMGSLTAINPFYPSNSYPNAGIGGSGAVNYGACGTVTINGGNITATGGDGSAGIGGGYGNISALTVNGGTIIINGGVITAQGGFSASGIGGGFCASAGVITITGGVVTAYGGPGGAGNSVAGGAGIGGGGTNGGGGILTGGNSGAIAITGDAVVYAYGGSTDPSAGGGGAGIGSGGSYGSGTSGGAVGSITIENPGNVTAVGGTGYAGNGADIGAGTGGNAASPAVAYYPVTFSVTDAGTASGSTVAATYNGDPIASGAYVPDGAEITFTATGAGASTYIYAWSGDASGTDASCAVTVNGAAAVTVACTVTGTTNITGAAVTVTAPAAGAAPDTAASTADTGYTCGGVTWSPVVPTGGGFLGSTQYTAQVTLTADVYYAFTGAATGTINGQTATAALNGDGTVTLSYQFPATAALVPTLPVPPQPTPTAPSTPPPIGPTPAVWENPFKDVHSGDWFYDDVQYVNENGLMVGTSADMFSPNTPLTRGMLVTILYRIAGSPSAGGGAPFSDVPDGQYYSGAVKWAAANGVALGYGDGTFGPDDSVTREQLAAILYRYIVLIGDGPQGEWMIRLGFTDNTAISDWAAEAVTFLYMKGVVTGYPDGSFSPQGDATRAEAAAMIHRFMDVIA